MNVLLITFSFPPAGGVGVLRALSLAKYLPQQGVRVDVLTARNAPAVGKDHSLLVQVPRDVRIHRTWTLDLPFALRKAIKRIISARPQAQAGLPPSVGAATQASKSSRRGVKELVGNLLLPDPQIGWLPFAVPAAKRIVRSRQIDLVLITVPPFSTVRMVSKLRKAFPALPIVLDFRDEWLSTTINLVSFNNNERARAVASRCEREGVRDATAVVAVTQAAQQELRQRYPSEDPTKFQYVPNGFDSTPVSGETRQQPRAPSGRPILLTYIGTVYGSTDPDTFVQGVLELPAELRARLKVRYIGHIETDAYRASLLRLGDSVELMGFMPQAKALAAISDTDYLLLITHDRINIAAKFYDYLAGGKPILAVVNAAGDVRRLLEETGAGRWAEAKDVAAIRRLMIEVLTPQVELSAQAATGPVRNEERIAGYHRKPLTARYAALLRGLLAESKAR